jgi:flagellar protein FliS
MSTTPDATRAYLRSAVLTASPEQLHLMLLDGAIRFVTRGREAIEANAIEAAFHALDRAQHIMLELSTGLRREANPLLADRMAALYNFVYRRLIDANLHRDLQAADDALRVLRHQRETWALLVDKLQRELSATRSDPLPAADAPPGQAEPARFVGDG